jgi:hypothetical protein
MPAEAGIQRPVERLWLILDTGFRRYDVGIFLGEFEQKAL